MSVSLCLMVRNEEVALPPCLQSAADLVDETIVVDTGSTDGTRELAAKPGARVRAPEGRPRVAQGVSPGKGRRQGKAPQGREAWFG